MLSDKRLRAALKKAPLVLYTGFVTRFAWEQFRLKAMPVGAIKNGGRYNRKGTAAIYTSLSRACAFAEFTQRFPDDMPLDAATMLSLGVKLNHVLDLTDPNTLTLLSTSLDELCSARFPGVDHPALGVGEAAADLGFDGIIAPSAVHAGKNLVIFPDAHVLPCYTIIRSIHRP